MTGAHSVPSPSGGLGFLGLVVVASLFLAFFSGSEPSEPELATDQALETELTTPQTLVSETDNSQPVTKPVTQDETVEPAVDQTTSVSEPQVLPVESVKVEHAEETGEQISTNAQQTIEDSTAQTAVESPVPNSVVAESSTVEVQAVEGPSPSFTLSENAQTLADRAKNLFENTPLVNETTGQLVDDVKTGLIELVDQLQQKPDLVVGIASRLGNTLGMTGFDQATQTANTVADFFVANGVKLDRLVSGVLAPDYVSQHSVEQQVLFFFAERTASNDG